MKMSKQTSTESLASPWPCDIFEPNIDCGSETAAVFFQHSVWPSKGDFCQKYEEDPPNLSNLGADQWTNGYYLVGGLNPGGF